MPFNTIGSMLYARYILILMGLMYKALKIQFNNFYFRDILVDYSFTDPLYHIEAISL